MPSTWDHIRAALIVGHLVVLTIACLPHYNADTQLGSDAPEQIFGRSLADLGLVDDPQTGADGLVAIWRRTSDARTAVLSPFLPYMKAAGITQQWRMFGRVETRGSRLEVHGRDKTGTWRPLYVEQSPHQWKGSLLNQARIRTYRSLFTKKKIRNRYDEITVWLAREALADPDLEAIRVRQEGVRIPKIARLDGHLQSTGFYWETILTRQDLP